ncbi:YLR283W-like protein [Saccharomyces kudriavzevii IFO 1802]|uniref:YLR283W-like protein n=1 Tax=Saccharomyces kudriavzevii (strain ATCC MYA-4449 / AS 2.2408 / CBS 8840 / NBRC 1802 / NCYC 2889) TaxID=226230 RepID=J5PMN1_SACK1|nr:YLR283W-like protein [Saccharomyces kudriavzevii IFO 1802]
MIRLVRASPLRYFQTKVGQGSRVCLRYFNSHARPLLQKSMSLKNLQISDTSASPLSHYQGERGEGEGEGEGE